MYTVFTSDVKPRGLASDKKPGLMVMGLGLGLLGPGLGLVGLDLGLVKYGLEASSPSIKCKVENRYD